MKPGQYVPLNLNSKLKYGLAFLVGAVSISHSASAAGFDCLIEPLQVVEIASPATGLLEHVSVRRGDRVSKGQVVANLESKAEKTAAALAKFKSEALGPTQTAQSKIDFAKVKYDRTKAMAEESLVALQDRDDAEAELRLAQLELVIALENRQQGKLEFQQQSSLLNLRSIRSPIDGVVVDQMLNAGEMADPTSAKKAILKLAQIDPLRVEVVMPASRFNFVKVGMTAQVLPELQGTRAQLATVAIVDRVIDASSNTFRVRLTLPNRDLDLPSGVRCKVEFGS